MTLGHLKIKIMLIPTITNNTDTSNEEYPFHSETKRINLNEDQQNRVKKGLKRNVIVGALLGALAGVFMAPGAALVFPAVIVGGSMGLWRWISKK